MARPRVFFVDMAHRGLGQDPKLEREGLGEEADLMIAGVEDGRFPDAMFDADAILLTSAPVLSESVLRRFTRLRVIVRLGVGYDNVDVDAARELGIPVCNVPDYGTEEVADHALLLTLALQRKFYHALNDVRGGNWSWQITLPVRRARGQRFGIVGCGRIGTATALRAKAFGFEVQFYDPYVASGYEKGIGVSRCSSLKELLESSDVVSLHCPLSNETRGMIGRSAMMAIKRGAFLVNTARGPLIPEADLLDVMRSGHLGGVALDVLDREPVCHPELFTYSNCLITPHIAFYSEEALMDMRVKAVQNVLGCLRGLPPVNVVNHVVPVTKYTNS
jgi:phosphoglycerate dehydrogenase-like enzyme